jgi:ribonuclease D
MAARCPASREDTSITKIIHDCRMDADAFQHHLAICLSEVHDTT